jgi:hypothetical protein
MTNIQKYLGVSKLTTAYKGVFFDDKTIEENKLEIGKVIKTTNKEIVFVSSEETNGKRVYSLGTLVRVNRKPQVMEYADRRFSSSEEAIVYFENTKM